MDAKKLREDIDKKRAKHDKVKADYKLKEKDKPLTQGERLDRIEKLLGLQDV